MLPPGNKPIFEGVIEELFVKQSVRIQGKKRDSDPLVLFTEIYPHRRT